MVDGPKALARKAVGLAVFCSVAWLVLWLQWSMPLGCQMVQSAGAATTAAATPVDPTRIPKYAIIPRFAFHVYRLPAELLDDLVNRANPERLPVTPLLDWRNDNMQLMASYFITKYLPLHPYHTDDPEAADVFIVPHYGPIADSIPEVAPTYTSRVRDYLVAHYDRFLQRRRLSDHFVFDFSVGSRFGSIFKPINRLGYEIQPHTLLYANWHYSADNIIMPFVEMTPRLLERQAHLDQLRDDEDALAAFVAAEQRATFAFFSASYTGPSGPLRARIMKDLREHNESEVFYLGNRHSTDKYDVLSGRMLGSVFCPCPSGDSPAARRAYTAVLAGCIPVILSDFVLNAYAGVVDWAEFSIQLPTHLLARESLIDTLQRIPQRRVRQLQMALARAGRRFVFHHGAPQAGDALDTLVEHLALHAYKVRRTHDWMIYSNGTDFRLRETGGKALNFFPANLGDAATSTRVPPG